MVMHGSDPSKHRRRSLCRRTPKDKKGSALGAEQSRRPDVRELDSNNFRAREAIVGRALFAVDERIH